MDVMDIEAEVWKTIVEEKKKGINLEQKNADTGISRINTTKRNRAKKKFYKFYVVHISYKLVWYLTDISDLLVYNLE